jgi:predicted amidohydrolase YtcJ
MHLSQTGEALQQLNLRRSKSLDEIREKIRAHAKANPDLPRILCGSWFHPSTDGNELASQLDDLDPRPIYINADDLHSVWVNSAALEELGAADMKDPPGGKIRRDESGKPSGVLEETAAISIVWPFLSNLPSPEQRVDFVQDALDAYMAAGYTGIVEMAMGEESWQIVQDYRAQRGELPIWMAAHWFIFPRDTEEENLKQVDRAIELNKQFNATNSPQCRIAGIKVMCDGVVDACTASLKNPYSHTGENADTMWTMQTLAPVLKRADEAGLQCALHAIGDAAIKLAIDALEVVDNRNGRHRIEHLETCAPEDVPRLGQLGITASVQPVHLDPAGLSAWQKLLGPSRCNDVFPYSAMAKFGAALALGTDSPTAPYNPLPNLYIATTRRSALEPEREDKTTPQFALDMASAVSAATLGAAYSSFADGRVGKLQKGYQANLTVVDMEWEATKLLDAKTVETWVSGKRVFEAKV